MSSLSSFRLCRSLAATVGLILLVAASVSYVGCRNHKVSQPPPPDMVAVLHFNNNGVGHMDRFEYANAVEAFRQVVKLAPDWLPGRINLGIALLNDPTPENLQEARDLFD